MDNNTTARIAAPTNDAPTGRLSISENAALVATVEPTTAYTPDFARIDYRKLGWAALIGQEGPTHTADACATELIELRTWFSSLAA